MSNLLNLKLGVAEASDLKPSVQVMADAGAVTIKPCVVVITKATAAALTLAAPTTAQNGTRITFVSATAAAHTVTATTIGFNAGDAAKDVGTFGAAIGNGFEVVAYGGEWLIVGTPVGVTFA